jgi:hypothetical protein
MPDDHTESDAEIIRAAYAEKVKEAFKVFAENVGMGQNQKASTERFVRSLELMRKARDLALEATAASAAAVVEPAREGLPNAGEPALDIPRTVDLLSAEDQALIEQALAGTTGHKPPPPRR